VTKLLGRYDLRIGRELLINEVRAMSERLNIILQQLAQEGRVESKGVFTIDAENVRQKLATFQFQRSGQWILKVIQALVAGGAERTEIRVSHTRLLIDYICPNPPWREADLEVAFNTPDRETGRALKPLAQALWHVSFKDDLLWSFAAAQSNYSLCWTGHQLVTVAAPPLLEAQLTVSHNQPSASEKGAQWAADMTKELANYAYTCPVPAKPGRQKTRQSATVPCDYTTTSDLRAASQECIRASRRHRLRSSRGSRVESVPIDRA
jgi:hypothetical protein